MANELEKEVKKPKKKVSKKKDIKEQPKKEVIVEEKKIEEKKVSVKKDKKQFYTSKETIIVMILSIIIGLGAGSVITRYLCDKKNNNSLSTFNDVYHEIKENSYKRVSKNDLLYSSLNGLISGLNDRYAIINDDKNAITNYEQSMEGTYTGIGITIYINEEGRINIISIFKDSPAEKNDLRAGDIISKLDGVEYDVSNYSDFSSKIAAYGKGKEVELEILRDGETITKKVELDEVNIESVYFSKVEVSGKTIGAFTINNFADNTYDQFYNYYKENKNEIHGIILDIRCSSEGKLESAAKIASLFVDKGTVLYYYHDDGSYEEVLSDTKKEIELPVIVVMNEGTILGGELLASTLNENLNVTLVGTKTFGKGLVQNMIKLTNGRNLLYSAKEWVTSKKAKVEEVGIQPTVEIRCEQDICENDIVFDKAVELLQNMI